MYIEHAAPVPKPINMLDTIVNYLFLLKNIKKKHIPSSSQILDFQV